MQAHRRNIFSNNHSGIFVSEYIYKYVFSLRLAGPAQLLASIRVLLDLVPCVRVSLPVCVVCSRNSFLQWFAMIRCGTGDFLRCGRARWKLSSAQVDAGNEFLDAFFECVDIKFLGPVVGIFKPRQATNVLYTTSVHTRIEPEPRRRFDIFQHKPCFHQNFGY